MARPNHKGKYNQLIITRFFGNDISEAETWRQVWLGHKPENIIKAMNAMLERDDISERIQIITIPTLIIHGANDMGIPLESNSNAQNDCAF